MSSNRFLIESALLGQGLPSLCRDDLLRAWPEELDSIAWMEEGVLVIGSMDRFLSFRDRTERIRRIDCALIEKAGQERMSGVLTASGVMAACAARQLPLAVSCGMGGVDDHRGGRLCPDLPALRDIPVTLLATACKDMVNLSATLAWLRNSGVSVLGVRTSRSTGYLFYSMDEALDGMLDPLRLPEPPGKCLLLNPIPASERIRNTALIRQGIEAGLHAEAEGRFYHPAVNAFFDSASGGQAAHIQLASIIANGLLALSLTQAE